MASVSRSPSLFPVAFPPGNFRPMADLSSLFQLAQQRAAERYQAEVKKLTAGLPLPFQLPI